MTNNVGATDRTHRIRPCFFMVVVFILYICLIEGISCASLKEDKISLRNLLAGAIRAAEIGGREVIHIHDNRTYEIENKESNLKKATGDLAETAEYKSHCAMIHFLSTAFPDVVIRSEDQYDSCQSKEPPNFDKALKTLESYDIGDDELVKTSDITVWIDPLDASKAFEENLLGYVTTMVCVAVKGVPVIGVIHKPFDAKLTYWGWADHGASRNLQNHPPPTAEDSKTMIIPRTHLNIFLTLARKFNMANKIHLVSGPGAGYKSLEVAVRNVTMYQNVKPVKKFRVCAGAAILSSVGGMMTSKSGMLLEDFGPDGSMDIEDGLSASWFKHKSFYDQHYKNIEKRVTFNETGDKIHLKVSHE